MFFTTLLPTVLHILANNPVASFGDSILIWIDKGVYRLVQTTFTLFIIMCQLNLSVIYDLAAPLVDRLKALIIVFIIFKVGVALIQYMLNPDKALEGSKKLLINILICAAMLVSCNFVFTVLNELSMMIIGKPDNYKYTVMSQIANVTNNSDEGLIMRLFFVDEFKKTSELSNVEAVGNNMAFNSLCATFPDINSSGLQCRGLTSAIVDGTGGYNIKKLDNVVPMLNKTVDGHPGIALLLGIYIIYSVVKASIEIGVRMFKLMLLQIVAPLAIISVASDEGTKAKPFANFVKMYISVFVSAFTRITAIFLVTIFVAKIFSQIDAIIGANKYSGYNLWIIIICIVAGYRFAGELPKIIDNIFETKLGDSQDKGFGKFLSTLVAAPALGVAGLASGIAGGVANRSFGGAVIGGASGLLGGLNAGLKGNTIAEKFKSGQDQRGKNKQRVASIAENGVAGWALGGVAQPFKGAQDSRVEKYDRDMKAYEDAAKIADDYDKAQVELLKDQKIGEVMSKPDSALSADEKRTKTAIGTKLAGFSGYSSSGIKMGESKDTFAQSMLKYNGAYQKAKAEYEKNKTAVNAAKLRDAEAKAISDAGDAYDLAKEAQTDATVQLHQERFNAATAKLTVGDKKQKISIGTKAEQAAADADPSKKGSVLTVKNAKQALGIEKQRISNNKTRYTEGATYKATHNRGGGSNS